MKHCYQGLTLIALFFFLALLGGKSEHPCTTQTLATRSTVPTIPKHFTQASWYGPGFFGNSTADGKVYDENAVFVAHRTYPFGTKLSITNLRNHRRIIATVEDRGPYVSGRDLDLSYMAAQKLGMIEAGVVLVSYSKLPPSPQGDSQQ